MRESRPLASARCNASSSTPPCAACCCGPPPLAGCFCAPSCRAPPLTASAGSGDLGNGTVTAKVSGNNGAITFTATTSGALGNGSGDSISYGQIATSVATLTSATPLAAPALADGSTTTVTLTPASGKVVSRDAKWTYTYLNQTVAAPGTYGGVNANNSRVTYTASMP